MTSCRAHSSYRSAKFKINLGRPFPPVRGWILQQVIKLAAVAACEEDVVLLVDSDIEFLRPFTAETFVRNGVVRFYRKPDEIDERLPRHMIWHRVARALLGLPPAEPPYTDYISSLLAWDPAIVRRMLERVTVYHRPPVDHRGRRTAPFLRVDALRRVRRRSDRRAGQFVRLGRPAVPGVLGRDPAGSGRRGRLPPRRPAHRRRCDDLSEVSHPAGGPARGLRRPQGARSHRPTS